MTFRASARPSARRSSRILSNQATDCATSNAPRHIARGEADDERYPHDNAARLFGFPKLNGIRSLAVGTGEVTSSGKSSMNGTTRG